jgi:hypothetical protein
MSPGARGEAAHDRILDFLTAISGCLFFVPTAKALEDPARRRNRRTLPTLPGSVVSADQANLRPT